MTVHTRRFNTTSTLHQRDPRSTLFDSYTGDRNRTSSSASPAGSGGYGYGYTGSAQPGAGGMAQVNRDGNGGFRSATPNSRLVLPLPKPFTQRKNTRTREWICRRHYQLRKIKRCYANSLGVGFIGMRSGANIMCGYWYLEANTAMPFSPNSKTKTISNWRV